VTVIETIVRPLTIRLPIRGILGRVIEASALAVTRVILNGKVHTEAKTTVLSSKTKIATAVVKVVIVSVVVEAMKGSDYDPLV